MRWNLTRDGLVTSVKCLLGFTAMSAPTEFIADGQLPSGRPIAMAALALRALQGGQAALGQLRSFAHKRPEERQARIPRERLIAKAIITPEAYSRISLDDLLSDRRRVMIERAYELARNGDEAL